MDNGKIHLTLDALKFYSENNITAVDWPAYSPDKIQSKIFGLYKVMVKWERICFNKTIGDRINKDFGINISRVNIENM